jgi:hypothetical protein
VVQQALAEAVEHETMLKQVRLVVFQQAVAVAVEDRSTGVMILVMQEQQGPQAVAVEQ